MRVLIVRLSSFGDVVHTFPALTELVAMRQDVEVDWLADEAFAAIARLHPAVSEVFAFPERRLRWPPGRWPAYLGERGRLRGRLRRRHHDVVVDLQGLLKSALVARLAGAPVAGYDTASIREPFASRLYDRTFAVPRDLHAVERNRRLLAAAVGYDIPDGAGAWGLAAHRHPLAIDLPGRFCFLVHSASWPSKLWPEENWRRLVEHLAERGVAAVLPWGSDVEKARAGRIADGANVAYVLPDRLDGADLAAVIGRADCAIGLDSGLMHLATAFGLPGVWLFGPTDPGLTGPYGEGQAIVGSTNPNAPCRMRDCTHGPDGKSCMDMVDFERVAAAVDALLQLRL